MMVKKLLPTFDADRDVTPGVTSKHSDGPRSAKYRSRLLEQTNEVVGADSEPHSDRSEDSEIEYRFLVSLEERIDWPCRSSRR